MRTCRKGHTYTGEENYRARQGKCPYCFYEVQRRYQKTEKGRAAKNRWKTSDKGRDSDDRYKQSPKGWLAALHWRRYASLKRRANRKPI